MNYDLNKAERRWEKRTLFKRRNSMLSMWQLWLVILTGAMFTAIYFVPFLDDLLG